jgi:hypothetical protein
MHGRLRDRQRAGLGLLQECTIECMRRWNKPALWGPNEGGRCPGCSATHSAPGASVGPAPPSLRRRTSAGSRRRSPVRDSAHGHAEKRAPCQAASHLRRWTCRSANQPAAPCDRRAASPCNGALAAPAMPSTRHRHRERIAAAWLAASAPFSPWPAGGQVFFRSFVVHLLNVFTASLLQAP